MSARFEFHGSLEASKSLMNRALIVQSYEPAISIIGESKSDDVNLMREGLADLLAGRPVQCGHAGAVLRFLALRAARLQGEHVLRGSHRLLQRLPGVLVQVLSQLGADAEIVENELRIQSSGWRVRGDGVWIPGDCSSQFASAVVLNAWDLPFALHFVKSGDASDSYFQMSLTLARDFGMKLSEVGREFSVPPDQKPHGGDFAVDCDVSSAFVVVAAAALAGRAVVTNFPSQSLQPDQTFIRYFIEMGIPVVQNSEGLTVVQASNYSGIQTDLSQAPDLFPVLSVLCAFAKTSSRLTGLRSLEHKESDRLSNTIKLLRFMGAECECTDGNEIRIWPVKQIHNRVDVFDPDDDHRMAMAAALAKLKGYQLNVLHPEVVTKSFPGFWNIFSRDSVLG